MEVVKEHKKFALKTVNIGIITVSSSRTIESDKSGKIIKEIAINSGHNIVNHIVVKDNKEDIKKAISNLILNEKSQAIIINGGTGISKDDITVEATAPLFEKELVSFNALFSYLSFKEIGSPALLSRATAGIYKNSVIFCLPGSPNAVKLAMKKLILPEIGHILYVLTR